MSKLESRLMMGLAPRANLQPAEITRADRAGARMRNDALGDALIPESDAGVID